MRPLDIQQIGNELAIKWDDGGESFIPLETLRRAVRAPAARARWTSWATFIKIPDSR